MRLVMSWTGTIGRSESARFARRDRFTNWVYALANRSPVLMALDRDFPAYSESAFHLTARLIEESARELEQRARDSRFYLTMHPDTSLWPELEPHFTRGNVTALGYVGLWEREDPRYFFMHDWHPTPQAHRLLADKMIEDILSAD